MNVTNFDSESNLLNGIFGKITIMSCSMIKNFSSENQKGNGTAYVPSIIVDFDAIAVLVGVPFILVYARDAASLY